MYEDYCWRLDWSSISSQSVVSQDVIPHTLYRDRHFLPCNRWSFEELKYVAKMRCLTDLVYIQTTLWKCRYFFTLLIQCLFLVEEISRVSNKVIFWQCVKTWLKSNFCANYILIKKIKSEKSQFGLSSCTELKRKKKGINMPSTRMTIFLQIWRIRIQFDYLPWIQNVTYFLSQSV